ncbi:MAG: hypothetical protein A3F46_10885 [Legionellales bacterium RIFCSPHIGHO2_12_FULL_42_9]|nr:MAG: hypothetical protein A3F46_10885 [Legionellales bacterium RIFCSPHIGHO2_12_FULL_42_9]
MKKLNWIIAGCVALYLTPGFAADSVKNQIAFDSAALLKTNSFPGLTSERSAHKIQAGKLFGGFFMYGLDKQQANFATGSSIETADERAAGIIGQNNNLYGHLFSRFLGNLFIDLAGGYSKIPQTPANYSSFYQNNMNNQYTSTWVASATALFSHTWKEFVFNANFGLTHINADYSPYMPFVAQALSSSVTTGLFDQNALANIGGGVTLNYKQYALRLEQQYLQQGNKSSNQSVLSLKLNLD